MAAQCTLATVGSQHYAAPVLRLPSATLPGATLSVPAFRELSGVTPNVSYACANQWRRRRIIDFYSTLESIAAITRALRMKFLILPMLIFQSGCTILAVADAGVSAAVTTVKVGVKAVSAVVDAVVPDKEKDKK